MRPATVRALLVSGILGGCLLFWAGCSVEKNYQLLSFFFDGVPDPNAPKPGDPNAPGAMTRPAAALAKLPRLSNHKPFVEGKCIECHVQGGTQISTQMDGALCLKCHEPVLTKYPAMHGPVVGKACMWCHAPHDSPFAALLRTEQAPLCVQCHERDTLSKKTPEHHSAAGKCLDCHFGHGGDRPPFLKPRPLAGAPATAPTTLPAPSTRAVEEELQKFLN